MLFRKKNVSPLSNKKRNLITFSNPNSPISEKYRMIRTTLELMSVGQKLQILSITSASPGEGKSTTADNLAVVYAQLGKNVILIDCDMRKPTAHQTFQRSLDIGLSTVLAGETTINEALQNTEIPRLMLLAAGPPPLNPTELIASPQMMAIFNDLRNQFDIIIVDTPPMMHTADASLLANMSDGTVLVVSCEKSNRQLVLKAKEQLERTTTQFLGIVLNKRSSHANTNYYASK